MVKNYLQIGHRVMVNEAPDQKTDAIDLLDSQLDELRGFVLTEEEKQTVASISKVWVVVKQTAAKKSTQQRAREQRHSSDILS